MNNRKAIFVPNIVNYALQDFPLYFELGVAHILDWQGYDHILFLVALCGVYTWPEWRQVLGLVTAFTLGHSISLALSLFNKIPISVAFIEFLIPVTILVSASINIISKKQTSGSRPFIYFLAMLFGLIHGLGFSNYLKSLIGPNILNQLLAFNVGLEIGQLFIVIFTLGISYIVVQVLHVSRREWNLFLSSAIFGIALTMSLSRLSPLFV